MRTAIVIWFISVAFVAGAILSDITRPVQAAPAESYPDSCEKIVAIGKLEVHQCSDLDGRQFLMNNYGFMAYQP